MTERDMTPSEDWLLDLARRNPWPDREAGPCPDDEILAARVEGGTLDVMHRQALDNHLAGCDLCRQVAQDLILDGAGEHLPSSPSLAAVGDGAGAGIASWWSSALAVLFPRRLVAGFAPVALTLVAVTALGAYAVPKAVTYFQQAATPPTPVKTVWSVTTAPAPTPARSKATPASPAPSAELDLPVRQAMAPVPDEPAHAAPTARPLREARTLPPAATAAVVQARPATPAPAPADAPGILFNEPIQPTPVVKAEAVVEPPAPPPLPERSVFTPADELFADELAKVYGLTFSKKYPEAMARADKLAKVFRKPHELGMLRRAHKAAQLELAKIQGPCPSRYMLVTRREGATVVEMCVLPEDAEKILDR